MPDSHAAVYRVIDANLNRLGEALRVVEEYVRFIVDKPDAALRLKQLRHALLPIQRAIDPRVLLAQRDIGSDCLAAEMRPEERERLGSGDVARANLKRAQEAARVLEEYLKIVVERAVADDAKRIRFALYELETQMREVLLDGAT